MKAFETEAGGVPLIPSRRDILARVFRQRHVAMAMFALVLGAFMLTGQFRSKYQAAMTILVRNERVDPVVTATQNSTPELQGLSVSEQEVNSAVQLLKAEDLLREVVLQAGLVSGGSSDPMAVAHAVKTLRGNLSVSALDKTDLLDVRYESGDPGSAKKVLAELGSLYLAKNQKLHGSGFEVSFFDDQVQLHENAMEQAALQLLAFEHKTGIVLAESQRDAALTQMESALQQRVDTDAALADAGGRTAKLSSELEATPARITTVSRQSDNPQLLGQIKSTLLGLQLKRAELLAKYDPQYRLVQDIDAQIAVTQTMLAAQSGAQVAETASDLNPVSSAIQQDLNRTQADITGLRAKHANLTRASMQLQQTASDLQAATMEQSRLENNLKNERDQHQLYVEKREQARASAALDRQGILNMVIASPPETPLLPEHSSAFMLAAALFTGTVLSVGAAFIADFFDPTVRNRTELEEALTIPILEEFGIEAHTKRGAAWL